LKFPGMSRQIIGMCYDVGPTADSNYGKGPGSLMLRVPFVAQKHVNLCSDASAMMILQAWGYATNRTTKTNPRGAFQGARLSDHTDLVNQGPTEWSTEVDVDPGGLDAKTWSIQLGQRGPIGCSISGVLPGTAHCVVLIGAYGDQGHVVIHDPWRGPRLSMSADRFNEVLRYYSWPVKIGATRLTTRGAAWAS
jgi:hypothetical protein